MSFKHYQKLLRPMTFKRTQCVTADVSLVKWSTVSCKLKSFLNVSAITQNVMVFSCTIKLGPNN